MKERRKQERKGLAAYTQVYDLYGGSRIGYLGDLTLKGAMAISEDTMQVNTDITLVIELPELPHVKTRRLTLPARVVWCEHDLSPQFYNVGFEFKEVTEAQKTMIESVIHNYEFHRELRQ